MRGYLRFILIFFFLNLSLSSRAEGFRVFEKDGYFGVLDANGEVAVPAVYSRLGWSDGSDQVQNGVIGYREKNLWGLITVRNKTLTAANFYTLEALGAGYVKASIKGAFSNRLFYGLLDSKGTVRISFNHFSIADLGPNWLVSDYENGRQFFGLVSFENELLIPKRYMKLSALPGGILQAINHAGHVDLFRTDGEPLQQSLDSLSHGSIGWTIFRDGYAGFLMADGRLWLDLNYKNIRIQNQQPEGVEFPLWRLYRADSLLLEVFCDSLQFTSHDRLIAHRNGAHHLQFQDTLFQHNHQLLLKEVLDRFYIVQNSKTRKWSLLTHQGDAILSEFDSIFSLEGSFAVSKKQGWYLASEKGELINNRPWERLAKGIGDQLIAKRNGYWGILNRNLEPVSPFKYDSIALLSSNYVVHYLNKKGLMNSEGDWVLRASFDEIYSYGDLVVGRNQKAYRYFYKGTEQFRSTAKPVKWLGSDLLIESEDQQYGLLNEYGELKEPTIYEQLLMLGDNLALWKNGFVKMLSPDGKEILSFQDKYQDVETFSDGLYVVKKDDRYGFVDNQGRLRISNRYQKVRSFSEGLAPVYLQRKWGFIDKKEQLRIQPHYRSVSPFENGIAVVADQKGFGLVDKDGHEVISLSWKNISRLPTGNFRVQNSQNKFGLIDMEGKFLLRPDFEYLEDLGQSVIVAKNGSWGILKYNGVPQVSMSHKEVKVVNNLTLIRD